MLALKVMLVVYAVIALVAVAYALLWPRLQRWLIARGARDAQWLNLADDPRGFKQLQAELRAQKNKS